MSRVRVGRQGAAVGALVVALASVAACGSGSGAGALPASGGTSAPASSPMASSPSATGAFAPAAQQALAAYRAAFADWAQVAQSADQHSYQSPVLAQHMAGQALSYVTKQIYIDTDVDHSVSKGSPVLHPMVGQLVPSESPTQVVVNDCVDTGGWLQYTTDGHLYNNVPGGHQKTQALVALANGAWKVNQLLIQPVGTCS